MDDCQFDISNFPTIFQIRLANFANGGRIKLNNQRIQAQQQKGPTCGLVALSMCLDHFGTPKSVEEILEKAKSLGFTKNGEMYSAHFITKLANEFLSENSAKVGEFPNSKSYCESICGRSLFLIPYDCGPNYQPVMANGHSAHWMLACGFVEKHEDSGFFEASTPSESSEDVGILGYQGKSTGLNIFPFSEVAMSNSQLQEAGAKRDPSDYVIPDANDLSEIRNLIVEIQSV